MALIKIVLFSLGLVVMFVIAALGMPKDSEPPLTVPMDNERRRLLIEAEKQAEEKK